VSNLQLKEGDIVNQIFKEPTLATYLLQAGGKNPQLSSIIF